MDDHLFDQVAQAVRSLVPDELGELHLRTHRRGVKAWFGPAEPPRQHFEAQMLPRRYVDGVEGAAIEIGFHAEHKNGQQNVDVLDMLVSHESKWRKPLGNEAEAGTFYGADAWRRVSEAWIEPDVDDPELAFEVAARLVDYLIAIEPVLATEA